ncbi:MAG TPA: sulfotransferase [Rudaea sp.]|nr:sulfotransferase [Rudaea sp.]
MTSGTSSTGARTRRPDSASATRGQNPQIGAGAPVLVLGMHRSGTSVLAGTLKSLGVAVGDEDAMLPAHPTDNPTGYWERFDVVASHDEFLASAGYSWSRVAGITASDFAPAALQNLEERLRQTIARLDRGGRPWLVKDPRLCLLLPQWSRLVDGIACVVAVRDPRDVAASILREQLRGAFTSNFLLALWEKYLRTALADLAGRRALFVSYERLLADPMRESARIKRGLVELGVTGLHDPSGKELEAFVDPRLQRSAAPTHSRLSESQQQLFAWLEAQTLAPSAVLVEGIPDGVPPDAVLREYEQVFDHFTGVGRSQAITDITTQAGAVKGGLAPLLEEFSARQECAFQATFGEISSVVQQRVRDLETALFESREREAAARSRIEELVEEIRLGEDTQGKLRHALESELKAEAGRRDDLLKRNAQLQSALVAMTAELESTRASRDRALDAAVEIRRALDGQLNARNGES